MELVSYHSLGIGKIVHKRTRDTNNFFQYNAPYLSINLSNTSKIHPFISLNKLNFFSIFYKQHGFRDKKKNLYDFAKNIADKHNKKSNLQTKKAEKTNRRQKNNLQTFFVGRLFG